MKRRAEFTWLDADRKAVQETYPDANFYERLNQHGEIVEACKLIMDPIPAPEVMAVVQVDLEDGNPVNIGPRGKIRHSRSCTIPREEHRQVLPPVQLTERAFTVELEYPTRLFGTAGSVHPKFRVLNPQITYQTHPHHPHLFVERQTGDTWACPISAQEAAWQWESGATITYLDYCAMWLLKTEIWVATGGRVLSSFGHWVGPATSHKPRDVIKETDAEGPCRCGNGQRYKDCCLGIDLRAMIQTT